MIINFSGATTRAAIGISLASHDSITATAPSESRCACGSLLARLGPDGVELKCRRCRRLVVIPWEVGGDWRAIEIHPADGPPRRAERPETDTPAEPGPRDSK